MPNWSDARPSKETSDEPQVGEADGQILTVSEAY